MRDLLRRVAAIEGRPLPILPVPLLTPRLSSLWLSLVTDVDTATGRALVDSMTNEVIVRDPSLRDLIPFDPMPYDDAVRTALSERRQAKRILFEHVTPPGDHTSVQNVQASSHMPGSGPSGGDANRYTAVAPLDSS
jgi:hypothetical protein